MHDEQVGVGLVGDRVADIAAERAKVGLTLSHRLRKLRTLPFKLPRYLLWRYLRVLM